MSEQPKSKAQRKRYPGHRACFNHEILTEGMKPDIPEICQNCFARIAKHQVNMIALNFTRSFIQGNRIYDLERELDDLRNSSDVIHGKRLAKLESTVQLLDSIADASHGPRLAKLELKIAELEAESSIRIENLEEAMDHVRTGRIKDLEAEVGVMKQTVESLLRREDCSLKRRVAELERKTDHGEK